MTAPAGAFAAAACPPGYFKYADILEQASCPGGSFLFGGVIGTRTLSDDAGTYDQVCQWL